MSLLYSTQRASLANAVSPVDRNDLIRACALAVAPEFNFPAALMDQNVADRGYTEPGTFRPRNRCPDPDADRVNRVDRRRRDYVGVRKVLSGCLRKFERMGWIDSICFRARSMDDRCSFNGFRVRTFN